MNYYHMTSLDRLNSISKYGLTPRNEDNSKLINDKKTKVFFSVGFTGAVALYVDFDIVFNEIKTEQMKMADEAVRNKLLKSKSLPDFLGEGVYLRFDGTGIKNERNFENGCTDMTILPEKLSVCILRKKGDNSIIFSRFKIIKYMMAKIQPEQIKYFIEATSRIQEKVKKYYKEHQTEIIEYRNCNYTLDFIGLKDFVDNFL